MWLPRSGARDLALFEGLDDVAILEVLEVGEADAALEALVDLTDVVLEPPQRGDGTLPDDRALAEEPDLGATGDRAVGDVATRDGADLGDAEDLADLGFAGDHFLELRGEHADH